MAVVRFTPLVAVKIIISNRAKSARAGDGTDARLPIRWPQPETGKIAAFAVPSGPVGSRRVQGAECATAQLVPARAVRASTLQAKLASNPAFTPA